MQIHFMEEQPLYIVSGGPDSKPGSFASKSVADATIIPQNPGQFSNQSLRFQVLTRKATVLTEVLLKKVLNATVIPDACR